MNWWPSLTASPAAAHSPTTVWSAGEIIPDPHTITLPPDLPPGSYTLLAGLYNPVSGERLAVTGAGANAQNNAILIDRIQVR